MGLLLVVFFLILSHVGTAQQIEFVPQLHGEKVVLPSRAVFVIANCLAEANKAASASFNMRVAECRAATWILGKRAGVENCFQFNRLKDLQLALKLSYADFERLIQTELHQEQYRPNEVSYIFYGVCLFSI